MNKILRVAITEYLNAVRSKAFIIGIIMLPVFMFGGHPCRQAGQK